MTVDYSKIDFTKCKLEPLPCPMADGTTKQLRVFAQWDELRRNVVLKVGEPGSVVLAKTGYGSTGWQFMSGSIMLTTGDACLLIDRAEQVNRFIAAETARIEAEEEEKNWVPVPWMDVMFLSENGTSVSVDFGNGDLVDWNRKLEDGTRVYRKDALPGDRVRYFADKRTFPAGYDPTKPRWVEVEALQISRLESAGCSAAIDIGTNGRNWCRSSKCSGDLGMRYAIDMHTLPHGVPLHEEVKPEWRPCTKGFANTHRADSQARFFGDSEWGNWVELHMLSFAGPPDRYEFRTTAKDEPAPSGKLTGKELVRFLIDNPGEHRVKFLDAEIFLKFKETITHRWSEHGPVNITSLPWLMERGPFELVT